MQTTSTTEIKEELAPRLRWAITRMARRLRQEAGTDLGPSHVAALARIEGDGPLSPRALPQRRPLAERPPAAGAHQAPDAAPDRPASGGGGSRRGDQGSRGRPRLDPERHP